jgi:hypothetical protein
LSCLLPSLGTNIYQYASKTHLAGADSGFFPLDTLNPTQATCATCGPTGTGATEAAIWTTCTGDQYLFPPRVLQPIVPTGAEPLRMAAGSPALPGVKHDSYFTTEARYFFAYDGTAGINSAVLRRRRSLHLHQRQLWFSTWVAFTSSLPGKVTVTGSPGDATFTKAAVSTGWKSDRQPPIRLDGLHPPTMGRPGRHNSGRFQDRNGQAWSHHRQGLRDRHLRRRPAPARVELPAHASMVSPRRTRPARPIVAMALLPMASSAIAATVRRAGLPMVARPKQRRHLRRLHDELQVRTVLWR